MELRSLIIGADHPVPVLGGRVVPHVNLDNAASTPALRPVIETIDRFLPHCSSVHRGAGYPSRLSTATFEQARSIVGDFVGADPDRDVVIFTQNTTEAINKLARTMSMPADPIVLTTALEHHSNELPWRHRAQTVAVRCERDGSLDLDDLDRLLATYAGRVALLAVTGASNVTGIVPPIHTLAARVHRVGGRILVDAAQLAAHRPIDLRPHDDPGHLDFVALSAHKMYAPFGSGALIGARGAFGPEPDHRGGGTVAAVTTDDVVWAGLPDRAEAGSPNVVGAVALAAAALTLDRIGRGRIAAHEAELTGYALARLADVPGIRFHGPGVAEPPDRVGVIPFTIDGLDHGLVAAALAHEHGVGVRNGCFCAHPYLVELLGLGPAEVAEWVDRIRAGDKRGAPGMVRISLGCYNDRTDIDRAVTGLTRIAAGDLGGTYERDDNDVFVPLGHHDPVLFDLTETLGSPLLRQVLDAASGADESALDDEPWGAPLALVP